MKESRGLEKEQTARKRLGNLRTRSKPLHRVRKRTKPFERDERSCGQRANGPKGTREFPNKEQTARKDWRV